MSDQTKWERIAGRRLESTLDELRKLTRTGSKDYEPIPAEHAQELIQHVQKAVGELIEAYRPYLGSLVPERFEIISEPTASIDTTEPMRCAECNCENGGEDCNWIASSPTPPMVSPLENPTQIALFVNRIDPKVLNIWIAHMCRRVEEVFYEEQEK